MAVKSPTDWLSLKLWTLREAAYLLCDREPAPESAFINSEMHSVGDVARAYRELKDATLAGDLKFIDADGLFIRRRVFVTEVVDWGRRRAQTRGLGFPDFLGDVANETVMASETGAVAGNKRRLSPEEESEIRQALRNGASKVELARKYGVHRRTIDRVQEGPKKPKAGARWHP
jgi:DNA-binding transcriptional regulator YiaG